jgi:hypothetical protein
MYRKGMAPMLKRNSSNQAAASTAKASRSGPARHTFCMTDMIFRVAMPQSPSITTT